MEIVARIGEKRNVYKILIENLERQPGVLGVDRSAILKFTLKK
jgi:hypothetical protein